MCKFKVGQVWVDSNGRVRQTIIAITDNPKLPIVTQDKDGDVWSYNAGGAFPGKDVRYDLCTLVKDVYETNAMDGDHSDEVRA